MPDFLVERLAPDRIALVYPLIREVAQALDLPRWARFARRLVSPRYAAKGGILVARRSPRLYPCGLVCYRRDHDLTHAAILTAEYFVALDFLDSPAALEALIAGLEDIARDLGCRAIRSLLPSASPSAVPELIAAGHERYGTLLLKVLGRGYGTAAGGDAPR